MSFKIIKRNRYVNEQIIEESGDTKKKKICNKRYKSDMLQLMTGRNSKHDKYNTLIEK